VTFAPRFPGVHDGWARFDGPAGTQMVDSAIDAMATYLRSGNNANTHGVFGASVATQELVDGARRSVGRLLAADPDTVVFGPNTTSLLLAFTRAVAQTLREGDEIVCTRLDHDANVTPWVLAARDAGARVFLADFDPESGRLGPDAIAALCTERTRWVAVDRFMMKVLVDYPTPREELEVVRRSLLPAVEVDQVLDVDELHRFQAAARKVFVDAVHLAPHRRIDVRAIGCDVLATSPYKWYGPHAGLLCGRAEVLEEIRPYKVRPASDAVPDRYETGTPSFEAIAGTAAAAEFLLEVGMANIATHEAQLFAPLLDGLLAMDHVHIYGPHDLKDRTPTVAFTVAGHSPLDVARALAVDRVAVWSGDYYAVEVMGALGLAETGAVRAGVACYTTPEDVQRLLNTVAALAP